MSSRLLSFLLACHSPAVFCGGGKPLADAEPVATVNGEAISASQLDAAIRPQVEALEERLRQIRQAALEKLIDNLLIEQAARGEGISVDGYLQTRVESVGVPPDQVDRAYQTSKDQFAGVLAAEAKYRIRRTLEDNARAAALRALLGSLRQKAKVDNRLQMNAAQVLESAAHEGPAAGSPDARVTIVEFSDFECRYCRAAQPALKRIRERWPGQVRHVFKHFPLDQHPHAMQAARASVCAHRQDRFWTMHGRIFAAGEELTDEFLLSAAKQAGLNESEFAACMGGVQSTNDVRRDILIGRAAGVTGTPAFFVNSEPTAADALEAAVETLLGGSQ